MTSRALAASGDVQSRNSSQSTASAVFGMAPACSSRSIAVRCAVWDLPPTASVTNIASYPAFTASTTANVRQISVWSPPKISRLRPVFFTASRKARSSNAFIVVRSITCRPGSSALFIVPHMAGGSGSRTPQGSRGTEGVLEKLDVVNFSISQLRKEGERRSDFLAGLAPAIGERAEHRDPVVLNQDLADLERLRLPRPPNPLEGADDGFRPLVRPGPGQIALELRVVLVERDVGDVRCRHAFHIGQIARVGDQRLEDLCG